MYTCFMEVPVPYTFSYFMRCQMKRHVRTGEPKIKFTFALKTYLFEKTMST